MGGSGGTAGAAPVTVNLPQLVDGVALANTAVYKSVPLHIEVTGTMDVSAQLDGKDVPTTPEDGGFVAELPIEGEADGELPIVVTATSADGEDVVEANGTLVVSARGTQLTDFDVDGAAATPRLHRKGDEAWVTFADRKNGDREAYLWRIDGAGRPVGDRIPLVKASEETHAARTAFGTQGIGILYQHSGGPWSNRFKVVDFDGNEVVAPIELDPTNLNGSFGGEIAYADGKFVIAWRSNDGTGGGGQVMWASIDETSGDVVGPKVVAASGAGTMADEIGGFEPFNNVHIASIGGRSFVTFVRGLYMTTPDFEIPRSQLVIVEADGTVGDAMYLGGKAALRFHHEARVFNHGDGGLLMSTSNDLLDPSNNPPKLLDGQLLDREGKIDPKSVQMIDAPDDRGEPFFLDHPNHNGVLLWLDHRSYTADILTGSIQLMAAPVNADLTVGEHVFFDHADPIAGLGQLHGTLAGTNALFAWIDDIGGVTMPRPEIYYDCAWY